MAGRYRGSAVLVSLVCGLALAAPATAGTPPGCARMIADFVPSLRGFECDAGEAGSDPGEGVAVKSWTVPAEAHEVRFTVFGGDDPAAGRGGTVVAEFPVAAGDVLTLRLGTGGGASLVERGSTSILVAGGGNGAESNYLAPGASEVQTQAPGAPNPPYPANGRIYVRWVEGTPPPQQRCQVPGLIGRRMGAARRRLVKAGCRVGEVRRRRTGSAPVYRVVKQWPKAGALRPAGTEVDLLLSRP